MKATGIVRRIDDLGRVVIPKEIRRTLRIREGDPLEIYTDREGEVILKKYSPMGEMTYFAKQYAEALAQSTGHIVCIADRDQVIAVAGTQRKEMLGKNVTKELENLANERMTSVASCRDKKYVNIVDDNMEFVSQIICPIISEGDVVGTVAVLNKDEKNKIGDMEIKLANCAAIFLGKQLEL